MEDSPQEDAADPAIQQATRERLMGEIFAESLRMRRSVRRIGRGAIATISTFAGINYFLSPDDRMTFTVIPAVGCVGLELLVRFHDSIQNHLQDQVIEYGTQDFPDSFDE